MYVINPHHRNGNKSKSQWTISEADEVESFSSARKQGWILDEKGWGLHMINNRPAWLGIAKDRTTQLFIAKFVGNPCTGSSSGVEWHGYPADYRNNHHDIPEEGILRKWLSESTLSPAKVRKIAKGQPCNL
jgi:hypothetical protein